MNKTLKRAAEIWGYRDLNKIEDFKREFLGKRCNEPDEALTPVELEAIHIAEREIRRRTEEKPTPKNFLIEFLVPRLVDEMVVGGYYWWRHATKGWRRMAVTVNEYAYYIKKHRVPVRDTSPVRRAN